MKTLEDHCVDYLTGLTPVSSTPMYRAECIRMWKAKYGEKFAAMVKRLAVAKIEGKK